MRKELSSKERGLKVILSFWRDSRIVSKIAPMWSLNLHPPGTGVYEILAKKHHVVLANPARTKAIAQAKIKTDKIDALTLANLLRGGYIAESYIPPKKVMELRELVRYRASLVKMRANLKNRIHAHLLMNNIKMEAKGRFSKRYIDELRTKINDPKVQGYLNILSSIEEGNT
jgi:transposase